ncbi:hypothetical protein [Streptomyces sp. NPDC020681]|uniref:hypothetical protein n=1 Tax=Streptomyces sp. NPDC020681 TaxID=3365083 RepID=UPI0037B4E77D
MSSLSVARAGAGLRLLRAAVFTAVCVVLSATGHALAACAAVPWWTLAAGFIGMFALVAPLAGRARSLPSIAVALTAGQLTLHALFGFGQQHLRLAPTADDALIRMAAKLMCGAGAASVSPSEARRVVSAAGLNPAGTSGPTLGHDAHAHLAQSAAASPDVLPSLPMVLGHLLAAVVTGWLLRRGDLALVRLIRLSADSAQEVAEAAWLRSLRAALALVRALRAGLAGSPDAPRAPRTSAVPPPPCCEEALQHSVIRRGPPGRLALAA